LQLITSQAYNDLGTKFQGVDMSDM